MISDVWRGCKGYSVYKAIEGCHGGRWGLLTPENFYRWTCFADRHNSLMCRPHSRVGTTAFTIHLTEDAFEVAVVLKVSPVSVGIEPTVTLSVPLSDAEWNFIAGSGSTSRCLLSSAKAPSARITCSQVVSLGLHVSRLSSIL